MQSATATAYATPSSDGLVTSPETSSIPHRATLNHIAEHTQPARPKQKRNKPTLSCLECVARKTKCDRAQPCLACVKRQSGCEYTLLASMLASGSPANKTRPQRAPAYINKPSFKKRKISSSLTSERNVSKQSPPFLLSSAPYAHTAPSNVFGMGTQHPFSNYWTCSGGLAEVVGILPSKDQSDILIAKFFEVVHPVYPFMHKRTFYADYDRFWSSSREEQTKTDPSFLAVLFTMFALSTQFLPYPAWQERLQTADFYCSAAHQALRIYSYLNRASTRSIEAMLLMTYFLMNGNHASDAYAWCGIHLRQAYAMRLHRDPDIVVPEASVLEKQQRRKLWQAVFHHDTFLTIMLGLPPTATHTDVVIESLADENEVDDDLEIEQNNHSRVENLMSISVIAPQQAAPPPPPPQPHQVMSLEDRLLDNVYVRSIWHLAELVQETISTPLSLGLPLANSVKHKESLTHAFERLYRSFPPHLTQIQHCDQRCANEPRRVRQMLFLNSNFFHSLMMLHAAEDDSNEVQCDVEAALEAAHHALSSFFHLWQCFEHEAKTWWVFQTRALEESLQVAHLITCGSRNQYPLRYSESSFIRAKYDVSHMMQIMEKYGDQYEMHTQRKQVLRRSFERIIG